METVEQLAEKVIEKLWVAESEARYDAYKRGELGAVEWDEVKKRCERL